MSVLIGRDCYKTTDGLLFMGQVACYIPFLSDLEGIEPHSGFCEEM